MTKQAHLHARGVTIQARGEQVERVGVAAHFQQCLDSEQAPFFAKFLFRDSLFAIAVTFLVLPINELLASISHIDRPQRERKEKRQEANEPIPRQRGFWRCPTENWARQVHYHDLPYTPAGSNLRYCARVAIEQGVRT